MTIYEILEKFKAENPELCKLIPIIWLDMIIETYNPDKGYEFFDPPLASICLAEPEIGNRFIQDRKWHTTFNNTQIFNNKEIQSHPISDEIMIYRTVNFPKKHLIPGKCCGLNVNETWFASNEDIKFFNDLLKQTKKVFHQSDIKNNPRNKGWGYSVTTTGIFINQPLIVAFNPAVDKRWVEKGNIYGAQSIYPMANFEELFEELGSLKRTIPFLKIHYPEALSGMQTNFCFFRSEKDDQISHKDLGLCKSLFEDYINFASPSIIISFSARVRNHFMKEELLIDQESIDITYCKGKLKIVKAKYRTATGELIPFIYLPHPMARVSSEERKRAWKYCFP